MSKAAGGPTCVSELVEVPHETAMGNAMDNPHSTPRTGPPAPDPLFLPIAAAGVAAIATALTAYATRSSRRATTADRKSDALVTYLRDHLSGSDAALQVVGRLAATQAIGRDGSLFWQLVDEFKDERATVRALLARLGASPKSAKRAVSYASGAVLSTVAGGTPGDLSLLRSLEGLAVGIQGKRCLWRSLQALGERASLEHVDYGELESRAIRQWEFVDERRRAAAAAAFD